MNELTNFGQTKLECTIFRVQWDFYNLQVIDLRTNGIHSVCGWCGHNFLLSGCDTYSHK